MRKVRTELSKKSKWYISKHRYYELYHWCLQYPEWKTILRTKRRDDLKIAMQIIEETAAEVGEDYGKYILKSVTDENITFEALYMRGMYWSKSTYLRRRRQFFWTLDQKLTKEHSENN